MLSGMVNTRGSTERAAVGVLPFEPFGLGQGLALRTMAVAAGVERNDLVPAIVALVDMAAQIGRAADLDGAHDPPLAEVMDWA